jgi:hypothetical protein
MASKSKRDFLAQHPDKVREVQARRASGAAGKHDSRPNRQRTRATERRAAMREYA